MQAGAWEIGRRIRPIDNESNVGYCERVIAILAKIPRLLHPFAFALAPVLHMGAVNILEVEIYELLVPCVVALVATTVMLGGLWLLRRDYLRCAALTSLVLVIFFGYGHAVDALWETGLFVRQRWLYTGSGVAALSTLLIAGSKLWRTSRNLETLSLALGVASLVFLAPSMWTLLSAEGAATWKPPFDGAAPEAPRIAPIVEERADYPDIYYIITDEYARADVLEEFYDHDNSTFLNQLRERGFYIAEQSFSNYALTFLSLASSLNLKFVNDDIKRGLRKRNLSKGPFYQMIRRSRLAQFLRNRGYRYVTIPSGWVGTSRSPIADVEYRYAPLLSGGFRRMLLRSTLLRPFSPSVADAHLYALGKLSEIPQIEGPTFTFLHLLLPHLPYVFERDGSVRRDVAPKLHFNEGFLQRMGEDLGDKSLYVDQLVYLNSRLIEVIDAILAESPYPPIIIIQGDHGTSSTADDDSGPLPRERLAILNAYYVPDQVRAQLYPGITPVNSFRLILSTLFGVDSPALPDLSFYSWYGYGWALRDVTGEIAPQ